MNRKLPLKLLVACLVLGAFIIYVSPTCMERSIPEHSGDGVFRNISHWQSPWYRAGYVISMPEFPLDLPFEAEYRVSGLTNLGCDCGVYLGIHDPDGKLQSSMIYSRWNAEVSLELKDSKGQTLVNPSGQFQEFFWFGSSHLDIGLYQQGKSFFTPNSREEYVIHVSYSPDPKLAGHRGFVCLYSKQGNGTPRR